MEIEIGAEQRKTKKANYSYNSVHYNNGCFVSVIHEQRRMLLIVTKILNAVEKYDV